MANLEYLWKDRKRVLGMPLSFTRYAVNEDRLFLETGMLNTKCEEVLLYRVKDISLSITLWQRIFGVGTITVKSSDATIPVLQLRNIKCPREVKEIIHQNVEEMKLVRRSIQLGNAIDDDECENCQDEDCCGDD